MRLGAVCNVDLNFKEHIIPYCIFLTGEMALAMSEPQYKLCMHSYSAQGILQYTLLDADRIGVVVLHGRHPGGGGGGGGGTQQEFG